MKEYTDVGLNIAGKAWLEFLIDKEEDQNRLFVNAYYQPKGLTGIIYWYMFLPFYHIIFKNLLKQIEKSG